MDHFKKYSHFYLLAILLLAAVFVWSAVAAADSNSKLVVAFLDVGQGDSIYIEAPNGNQVLVDGGKSKKVLRELSEVMPFYDRSIDILIATHPDQDHIGGLLPIMENYEVEVVIEPGVESDTKIYQAFENIIEEKGIKKVFARRGMNIILDKKNGVYLLILFPNQDVYGWDSNTASIVAKLVYGDSSFFLTGDSPKEIEEYLIALDGEFLESDVLKLGHHGSKTSSSGFFLRAASPSYAVISAGADNRYGHPHKEVLDVLEKLGISYRATYDEGTITFQSDGKEINLE